MKLHQTYFIDIFHSYKVLIIKFISLITKNISKMSFYLECNPRDLGNKSASGDEWKKFGLESNSSMPVDVLQDGLSSPDAARVLQIAWEILDPK